MKRFIPSAILFVSLQLNAQVSIDTVSTGSAYANNKWYSLENDEVKTEPATNWDLAFATTFSPNSNLATAVLMNYKSGSLYEVPGSSPANFTTIDTAGLYQWTPLYNSDTTWSKGAFNNTTSLGNFDYGWGTYDYINHSGIQANRVFLIKFTNGTFKKLMIDLDFQTGAYTLTYANLDNSDSTASIVPTASYSTKNFVYFSFNNGIVDREPESSSWDFIFHQYLSHDFNPPYPVSGIFGNEGVEVAQVYPVNDPTQYTDYLNTNFSNHINTIGSDWKSFTGTSWAITDSTVYFVKDKSGSIWKIIFTGFGGSSNGNYIFSKEKMSGAGLTDATETILNLYPNPANNTLNICTAFHTTTTLRVVSSTGIEVFRQDITSGLQTSSIDIQNIANGTYFIQAINDQNNSVQPFIIAH